MKKVNWKVRFTNPVFVAQIVLAILTPILAYLGASFSDLTTWKTLGTMLVEAYSNPYLLGLVVISVWNAINDPTVSGLKDSERALRYDRPNKDI